jgi:hypothetical protein
MEVIFHNIYFLIVFHSNLLLLKNTPIKHNYNICEDNKIKPKCQVVFSNITECPPFFLRVMISENRPVVNKVLMAS